MADQTPTHKAEEARNTSKKHNIQISIENRFKIDIITTKLKEHCETLWKLEQSCPHSIGVKHDSTWKEEFNQVRNELADAVAQLKNIDI
jgi:hypothetical protein